MKKILIIISIFLISTQNLHAQTEVKKPEEVFTMIFNVAMKKDKTLLNTLNNYTPRIVDDYKIDNDDFNIASRGAFDGVSKEALDICKKEIIDLNAVINNALANTAITIISKKTIPDEYNLPGKMVEITYLANFIVPQRLEDMERSEIKNVTPAEFKKFLLQTINELKKADKKVEVKMDFTLRQIIKDDKIYYTTSSSEELRSDIIKSYFMSLIDIAKK